MYSTGLLAPDPYRDRDRDARLCALPPYVFSVGGRGVVQPIACIRDQRGYPSCGGQSGVAVTDGLGDFGRGSAIDLWLDSQRRWNTGIDPTKGTYLSSVVQSMAARGVSAYREGEDQDIVRAGWVRGKDALADELAAYDHRISKRAKRYRVTQDGSARIDPVRAALDFVMGVLGGFGLRQPFFDYRADERTGDRVLGLDAVDGSENGHAMRIAGYAPRDGRWVFLLQNSWGESWGGARLPDGSWQPGCCWVEADVIARAWDIHCVEVML